MRYVLFLVLLTAQTSCWADIIYDVHEATASFTVTGEITTDGTLGVITDANIVDYSLSLGLDSFGTSGITATADGLFYGPGRLGAINNGPSWPNISWNYNDLQEYVQISVFRPEFIQNASGRQFATARGVPEPSSVMMLAAGLLSSLFYRRRSEQ